MDPPLVTVLAFVVIEYFLQENLTSSMQLCVIATILTSYLMRLALNEVVRGRCLEDCKITMVCTKASGVCDFASKVDQNWFGKRIAKSSNQSRRQSRRLRGAKRSSGGSKV